MTPIDVTTAVATERTRDLTRTADRSRLAAFATCGRPSSWGRLAHEATAIAQRVAAAIRPAQSRAVDQCCSSA